MQSPILLEENLISRIYFLRGEKVLLDFDLASLYATDTRTLKQAVRRTLKRFPEDFMFELTQTEWKELITTCDNLRNRKYSPALPFAFTEQGVAMLSSVLKSEKAIEVNIAIMRTFVQLRKLMNLHKELADKVDTLEAKYDQQIKTIFDIIKRLVQQEATPKRPIGFLTNTDNE